MSKDGRKKLSRKAKQGDLDDGGTCSLSGQAVGSSTAGQVARDDAVSVSTDTTGSENTELTTQALAEYFKAATANFEHMIKKAVDSLLESVQKVENKLEFPNWRTGEEERQSCGGKTKEIEEEIENMKITLSRHTSDANKVERFSRRNNFRIVGIPEAKGNEREDGPKLVENVIRENFGMDIKVERAHRDGKKADRPRHILVKMLSYRDKVDIIEKCAKKPWEQTILHDLTKADLEEKKKWRKEVKELYSNGTKLRFFAGKWRTSNGIPHNF